MLIPSISRYMTKSPHVIASRDNVVLARALMRQHRISHLPVVDGGRLVGIVSKTDVDRVGTGIVLDVMTPDVAVVDGSASLDEVVALMQTVHIHSIVIMGSEGVEGIFTATDAVRALGDVLERADQA